MALSHSTRPNRDAAPKSTEPEVQGKAAGNRQSRMGNAYMQQLVGSAIKQTQGQGRLDTKLSFGIEEDAGKYNFPEDGGSSTSKAPAPTERKQQQDALPQLREKHQGGAYKYGDVKDGKAFVKGAGDEHSVSPNDVAQGALGDCYLIAGMAAVARANPDAIQKLIKDKGDGTFEVTLYIRRNRYSRPEAVTKVVDAQLPERSPGSALYAKTGDKGAEGTEMWTALIEKTVAQHKGSYETIQGGQIANGFEFNGATELLTGKYESYQPTAKMNEDDILLTIAAALEAKKPVTAETYDMTNDEAMTKEAAPFNVHGNHAYAPEKVDIDKRTIALQNPWGSDHVAPLDVARFKKFYRAIRVGG